MSFRSSEGSFYNGSTKTYPITNGDVGTIYTFTLSAPISANDFGNTGAVPVEFQGQVVPKGVYAISAEITVQASSGGQKISTYDPTLLFNNEPVASCLTEGAGSFTFSNPITGYFTADGVNPYEVSLIVKQQNQTQPIPNYTILAGGETVIQCVRIA
jgi:hypothetical protein